MSHQKYDYRNVETVSGVEFKVAMSITLAFILSHFLIKNPYFLTFVAAMLGTGVWWYFGRYFKAVGDRISMLMVYLIMIAFALAGLLAVYAGFVFDWENMAAEVTAALDIGAIAGMFAFFQSVLWLLSVGIFLSGIRLLWINHQHRFPLKRIALSAMILVPAYLLVSVFMNFSFIWQLLDVAESSGNEILTRTTIETRAEIDNVTFWMYLILLMPYYFLLHHFYRADQATETVVEARAENIRYERPSDSDFV